MYAVDVTVSSIGRERFVTDEEDGRDVGHILLYGTLRAGQPAHRARGLERALTLIGPRRIGGALYDLGACPGLVLGGSDITTADLFRFDASRARTLLARLDAFEGYDRRQPESSLFVREAVTVEPGPAAPGACRAWVYVYNGPLEAARRIAGGSWPEYIAARGAPSRLRR